jgi:hypothetical protein
VKTRPFGREVRILAEKRAKCVILKRNRQVHTDLDRLVIGPICGKAKWFVLCIQRGVF